MMKRFGAFLLAGMMCMGMLTGAFAQTETTLLRQARMYDSAFDTKVKLLIPQGAEVTLVEIGEERVLVKYGSFCGWIDKEAVGEKAIAAFPTATPAVTQEAVEMVTPSPAAAEEETPAAEIQEEMTVTDSTQQPEENEETVSSQQTEKPEEEAATLVPTAAPTASPQPTATPVPTIPPLKENSSGERVEQLQQNLTELGYPVGRIDGYYGKKTRNAVVKLQRMYGLYADGIAGEDTLALIEALLGPNAEQVQPAPLPFVRTLRKGRRGEEVEKLQKALVELGYLTEEQVTAVYDADTLLAVKTFQTQAGLESDGIAGEKTIFVLSGTLQAQRTVQELNNK